MGEIRFVGTGETRGYPYPVCKKIRDDPLLRHVHMLTSYTFEDWLSSHCISILFAESITGHWKLVWTCEIHSHNPLVRNPRWNVKLFFSFDVYSRTSMARTP